MPFRIFRLLPGIGSSWRNIREQVLQTWRPPDCPWLTRPRAFPASAFARNSIMSTEYLPFLLHLTPSAAPVARQPSRCRFVFLPMSFAVHLQTQFSRASGPFRAALPTFHPRVVLCGKARGESRSLGVCCVKRCSIQLRRLIF